MPRPFASVPHEWVGRSVVHPDRRRHGPFGPDRGLGLEPHLHPHPGWETMCDERSLERDHRPAFVESL